MGTVKTVVAEKLDGKPIRNLQNMLMTISHFTQSIPSVIPDGIFGQRTKDSVLEFQKAYGLAVNGEVDKKTWNKIRDVFLNVRGIYSAPKKSAVVARKPNIQRNDELLELFVIQSMMYALAQVFKNIPSVDINGKHDSKSAGATAFIQDVSGIEPTGVIDTLTYNMISNLYSSNVAKIIENKYEKA